MKADENTCLILLPGFSPDDFSVQELRRAFEARGYHVKTTNFFGNVKVEDFRKLTMEQCVENISAFIEETKKSYDRVIGVGVSLGACLLLDHAKKHGNLSGIMSIATPFKMKLQRTMRFEIFCLPAVYHLWNWIGKKKGMRLIPIGAGPAVYNYVKYRFVAGLEKIKTPVLFLHSKKDMITDYKAVPEFANQLSSEKKKVLITEDGAHLTDHDPNFVVDCAEEFFD